MFVQNKVALVTGGASGIGLYYVLELLKNGLRAATLADVDAAKGQEAVTLISRDFGENKVLFVKTDVTKEKELRDAFEQTVDKFGNLDIVINNAGILNDSIWEKQIAINLNGTIYGCLLSLEEYLPKYKSDDEGVIVNISSIVGLQGVPFMPVYSATKHAVIGLSRSFGTPDQYETTKVRVVTICPGGTNTPLMQGFDGKTINERHSELFRKSTAEMGAIPLQSIDIVPKCLIRAIEEGSNGSIWVAEDGEIYEIEFPERQQMKKK